MIIIPAVDICDGKVVRLTEGDFKRKVVYHDDPAVAAKRWEDEGAQYIHVVDLDGACLGVPVNMEAVERILSAVKVPVQLGGGIRTMETIEHALGKGVSRVILGTRALQSPQFVRDATAEFGEKIAVAIDSYSYRMAVEGWENITETSVLDFAVLIEKQGVKTIVFTDIKKDGALEGPNLSAIKEMLYAVNVPLIVSGGVSTLDDISALKKFDSGRIIALIIGKALYTGDINLKEAIEISK